MSGRNALSSSVGEWIVILAVTNQLTASSGPRALDMPQYAPAGGHDRGIEVNQTTVVGGCARCRNAMRIMAGGAGCAEIQMELVIAE
jgi:hypothetical protein